MEKAGWPRIKKRRSGSLGIFPGGLRKADDRLGRASSPPGTNGQGVSCRGSHPASPSGEAVGVRLGFEPDEGVWSYLKNVELRNLCCRGLDHLKTELWGAKEWLRHKVEIIKSVFREVGLA